MTLRPGTPTLERYRSSRLIADRSFRIVVDWDYRAGDEGVVLAHGGQESGYVLYVEDGELHFAQNAAGEMNVLPSLPLGEASSEVAIDVCSPGDGTWEVEISLDGDLSVTETLPQLALFLPFEGIDVGIDRRSPVSWELYERRRSFPFTGVIRGVTYVPGDLSPGAGELGVERAIEIGMGLD